MILDYIKKANVEAIKTKNSNARAIYSIVMNKALLISVEKRTKNEEFTDIDMIGVLQKTLKELADEKENYIKAGKGEQADIIELQIKTVEKYLPQMLSLEEVKDIISKLEDKSVPFVMKYFKANYAGKVDMKVVNDALRS